MHQQLNLQDVFCPDHRHTSCDSELSDIQHSNSLRTNWAHTTRSRDSFFFRWRISCSTDSANKNILVIFRKRIYGYTEFQRKLLRLQYFSLQASKKHILANHDVSKELLCLWLQGYQKKATKIWLGSRISSNIPAHYSTMLMPSSDSPKNTSMDLNDDY